jgi:N-acyl-D-aspartate/D-glutamate deacylase
VASEELRTRFDLPGGAGRLYAGAHGVEHVLVNGQAIVRDGTLTDARSGTLVRSGQHTATPALDE